MMLELLIDTYRLVDSIKDKARDALSCLVGKDKEGCERIQGYMLEDYKRLADLVPAEIDGHNLSQLHRHISWGEKSDYEQILTVDAPGVLNDVAEYCVTNHPEQRLNLENILHPAIINSSLEQYNSGQYRDSVLNAIIRVFELMREKTGCHEDGQRLIGRLFSPENPKLIFKEIETETGRNDQEGFKLLMLGAYLGIRNPKAHSLDNLLDDVKAAQYLAFASILARRVEEPTLVD